MIRRAFTKVKKKVAWKQNFQATEYYLHVFIHILQQSVVRAPATHAVLKQFHRFDAGHVCKEFAHDPDAVRNGSRVEEVIAACA